MTAALPAVVGLTSPIVWYTTRATGTVALVLLTATVVLGVLTSTRAGSASVPRFAVSELHRRVSLVAMCFLALHVFTAVVDTFVPVGWPAALVPFVSGYAPFWVGIGAVAFDLLLAVVVTSLLRARIPARLWRAVHWLVYLSFPLAVAHTVGVGTDLRFGWMDLVTAACLVSVLVALGWRLWASPHTGGATTAHPAPRPVEDLARRPMAASSRNAADRRPVGQR